MTKSEMAAKMGEAQAWLPGKKVKLDFGAEGAVMLDGVGNRSPRTMATPTRRSRSPGPTGRT